MCRLTSDTTEEVRVSRKRLWRVLAVVALLSSSVAQLRAEVFLFCHHLLS